MSVGWYFLLAAAGLDLLLPFLLAPFYPGYSHRRQVMSVLGSPESPARWVYRVWLVALGLLLCAATPDLWAAFGNRSPVLTGLLIAVLCVFALGAGVLAGLFSVNADKAVETAASRIHGVGSVLGFLALALCSPSGGAAGFSGGCRRGRGILPWSALPSMCAGFTPLCYGGQGGVAWHPAGPGGHMAAAYVALHVSAAGPSGGRTAHSEIDRYQRGRPGWDAPLNKCLQNDADQSAGALVDDALECLLELGAGVIGHALELPFKSSLTSSWKDLPKMLDCQMALVSPSNS